MITKTAFLQGLKCDRQFYWISTHSSPSRKKEDSHSFRQPGLKNAIFRIAKELYPDGVEVAHDSKLSDSISETLDLISKRKTIYNASIGHGEYYCRIDILCPKSDESWDLIEVRTHSNPKSENWMDLGFQKFVLEKLGIKINELFILYINSTYVFDNSIRPDQFFKIKNATLQVENRYSQILENITYFNSLLEKGLPEKNSRSCKSPKDCKFQEICWEDLGDGNVFQLREGGELSRSLYSKGIYHLKDISDDEETSRIQKIQIECDRTGKPHLDANQLQVFIQKLSFPIYYLDFETINPVIPIYQKSKPFQHIPFLYSLHIEEESGEIKHFYDMEREGEDPRFTLMKSLTERLGSVGSIVCFNDMFEKKCIRESSEHFSEFLDWSGTLWDRFLDLSIPFKELHYYHPNQKGLASLKAILKPLTGLDYSALSIQDGSNANNEYLNIKQNDQFTQIQMDEIRTNLIEYCKMDTFAMYRVLSELKILLSIEPKIDYSI
ncbi:MAG: DUF2779 domain-containing protein [Leptospiraceae bacterium]|nr:DUF2779 domain-containing protein [Leptospiraceae bacterium]MCP5512231.1 DUF2779 domain-containing protein [Leptospiraceae bacterium]